MPPPGFKTLATVEEEFKTYVEDIARARRMNLPDLLREMAEEYVENHEDVQRYFKFLLQTTPEMKVRVKHGK